MGRTAQANRNLLRLHIAVEELWKQVVAVENMTKEEYGYVLFLRDDSQWMADFDLNKLIVLGDADVYVLSCDVRDTPSHVDEINDHALVVTRKAAELFGMYFTNMFKDENLVENCAKSMKNPFKDELIGCNSEMILKYIIENHKLTVIQAGQSFIPFQRSMHVNVNGKVTPCFHKYCQSKKNALGDNGLQQCKKVQS